MKTLYVGNFPYNVSEHEIRQAFENHGKVHSVKLIKERETGRPRGFGFIEMDDTSAVSAKEALNNTRFGGRNLRVDVAKERSAGIAR
ncbi:MAG: RNA-binding protein [Proteobacteria bacterium]|nr:RNA-binding protein [Pseudomonadota bacterium]MBU1709904.1 RNA-binding protein [Pseudomonadota bacterium]